MQKRCSTSWHKPVIDRTSASFGNRSTKLVRTSRQMFIEIGREPTSEELAEKLAMPIEKVRKVLEIARAPINLRG